MSAQVALRNADEGYPRYRQLVELSPDGILIHDGERVVFGNAAALRLAGATRLEQVIGLPVDRFLAPPHLKAVQARLTAQATPTELTLPVRDTFRRLDGSAVEVEVQAVAFVDGGRLAAHLVIRDISARLTQEEALRSLEERLTQVRQMEAIGSLAGGVAHEVNNMMGVVLGFGESLLQRSDLSEDCRADVGEMVKGAERAAAVTRQLLAYSRRAFHQPKEVDLRWWMHSAEPMVRKVLGNSQRLVVEAAEALPVWVDPGQLRDLLLNLALNARDAMPEEGTLTLTLAPLTLSQDLTSADGKLIPPGRYAALEVSDDGAGMDSEVQARVFEPFFTTKGVGGGTGLGMAAAQGALSQNGGYITLESAPGEGTTFTVLLPLLDLYRATEATGGDRNGGG